MDFELLPVDDVCYLLSGQDKVFPIAINNTGNVNVTVTFDLSGEPWCDLNFGNLIVPYGGMKVITLSLSPDASVSEGVHHVTLTAKVTPEGGIIRELTFMVQLVRFDLAVTDIRAEGYSAGVPLTLMEEQALVLCWNISNLGDHSLGTALYEENLTMELLLNDVVVEKRLVPYLPANSSVGERWTYLFSNPGTYRFEVTVNAGGMLGEIDVTNNRGSVEIEVLSEEEGIASMDPDHSVDNLMWVFVKRFLLIFVVGLMLAVGVYVVKRRYGKTE